MVETRFYAQRTRKSEASFPDVAGANQPLIPPDPPCPSGVGVTRWGGFLRRPNLFNPIVKASLLAWV